MKTKKLNTYTVHYTFDGVGEVKIEASSKKKAEEIFDEGEYPYGAEEEWGNNYCVAGVEKIK